MIPGLILLALLPCATPIDGIVAVVGSVPILYSEVVELLSESGVPYESARLLSSGDVLFDEALEALVDEKLLVEAARREGLYPPPAQVHQRVDAVLEARRSEYPNEASFLRALSQAGMDLTSYREFLAGTLGQRMAAENYVRQVGSHASMVLPADPEAYLQENLEDFRSVMGCVNLSWIYLPVLPGNTLEEEALLGRVRQQLETGEATFEAMAMEYSQDGSARTGGDLGWFSPGDMTPAFESQLKDLETGAIAGPFLTPFGVHLAMVTEREENRIRASHILRLVPLSSEDVQRVSREAEGIVAALNHGEITFPDAAARYSLDPDTRGIEGRLGTVILSGWDEGTRRLLEELEPGGVSEPVFLEQGSALAIFRAEEDPTPDFSAYSLEELEEMVSAYQWQSIFQRTVAALRSEIPVFYMEF